nr:hypothetical protein CFP56_78121 [Quercus suber]
MGREVLWVGARVKLGKRVKWVYERKSTRRRRTMVVFLMDFSPELFADVRPISDQQLHRHTEIATLVFTILKNKQFAISCNLVTQQHGFGIWLQGGCRARFWQ